MIKGIFLTIAAAFLFFSCSGNFLKDVSDKNSDDALIYDAQTAVNAQDYDTAINILTVKLSSSGQTRTDAREILASAYAGKCGLNFIDFTTGLSNATSGSAFVLASKPFVGVAVSSSYCLTSLQTLDLIGTTAQRTVNENAFASVVGMVLMGSATRLYTDNSPVNGDGNQDAANISCSLTDPQIDEIILGYGYMSQNFSALSSQIGSASSTFSGSISTCQSVAGASCQITNAASIDSTIRDTMRDLLNTSQYGVGTFDGSNPANIPNSCP
ncbi:MAG: hypothetical protein ACXWQQ_08685 [Pseudobdellovibrio sp.]